MELTSYLPRFWEIPRIPVGMTLRRSNNNKLPDTVFIQIDGGKENVSRIFLGMCELLVSKGLTKKILVTRLPPGCYILSS